MEVITLKVSKRSLKKQKKKYKDYTQEPDSDNEYDLIESDGYYAFTVHDMYLEDSDNDDKIVKERSDTRSTDSGDEMEWYDSEEEETALIDRHESKLQELEQQELKKLE